MNGIVLLFIIFLNHIKCCIFSIIIPIYNTGKYLEDSIGSLINQTIGYKNIQIIIINDGSIDNGEDISLEYKNMLKNNLIYIQIHHDGVSKARNVGLKYVSGKYVNFLDSDDKWDYKALRYINFFFNFFKNVDLVSGRIKYFDLKNKFHHLDYKFNKSKVVNLSEEYSFIQLHAASSFFRIKSIKGNKFDENISVGEDLKFVKNIIIYKPIIGFIRDAIYYYRKRSDYTSVMQNKEININFYLSKINYIQKYFIDKSNLLYQEIVPFIQFYFAYDVLFRIAFPPFKLLNSSNIVKYRKLILNQLKQVDDKYILEQKILSDKLKVIALSKKYNHDIRDDIKLINQSILYYSNYSLINLSENRDIIIWKYFEIKNNIIHLEGEDKCWIKRENYYYYCQLGKNLFFPKYYHFHDYDFKTIYGIYIKGRVVSFDIKIEKENIEQAIHFYISYKNRNIEIFPSFYNSTHFSNIKNYYYVKGNYIIENNGFNMIIYKYKYELVKYMENNYCKLLKKKYKEYLIPFREKNIDNRRENIIKDKYQIWIITDKKDKAGNNGEYFFRYLKKYNPKGIYYYFAIQGDNFDYKRLKSLGNIIDFNSIKYLNIFLKSDKIISSTIDSRILNPFDNDGKYMLDLYKFDFIFLQNEIIKDIPSKHFWKKQNCRLLIVSSIYEYKVFLKYNYKNTKNRIALTGLPRYDYLRKLQKYFKSENIILLVPEGRNYLKGTINFVNHKNIISESFTKSNYFSFYNNLINNEKLLHLMKINNYTGIFCLDDNFMEQKSLFKKNNLFRIKTHCNINTLLVKSSLLITDYSSLFFDFGYIQKPVIFAHFDFQEYRKFQSDKEIFDYKKDGFGPICYNIPCTVKNIISEIENKCQLKKRYFRRIKKFFFYFDEQNNNRIYNEIIEDKSKINIQRQSSKYEFCFIIFIFSSLILCSLNKKSY